MWKELPNDKGYEIATTVHTLNKSKYAYTLVVIRWKKDAEQKDLFSDYCYHSIITNFEESPEEVLKFHRGRGEDENIFKELKHGCEAEHLPSAKERANGVFG